MFYQSAIFTSGNKNALILRQTTSWHYHMNMWVIYESLHPHIHCIVPAAGYTLDGRWKNIGHAGNYLYPVHQLSDAFKGRFLDSLKRALRKQNTLTLFDHNVQQA